MQLNKVLQVLLVGASVLVFAGCSSTSDEASESSETTERSQTGASEESAGSGVQTGAADRILTPEEEQIRQREERQQRYADLRRDHVLYFDFDNAAIRDEFAELLAAHADYLMRNPAVTVVIEGHTDERGTPEYNIALGERRAKSVVEYMESLGVSRQQMTMVSYGEEKPVVRQSNERAWSQNRRAVLVY
ncbi:MULTISPECIES: peptidoglycan-associated lipoprotein Pal [Gammaproteobacteria]|uniref:peptidoglycan-associated lipoprotein Pal n=1 Tax=Gammaproteobacteria TaxID=1236 RepID=UPI000DD0CAFC|nr:MULTISPECIES: peptidoglycan-associated lipoprotein Pal [Gammaproteobacteria]RTE87771.1 peptidoglycan-associated lipoprotein Pal [Aliidiomarina sp. B3213]TCZ92446.1 peptidoglycan-associated lipoprotein Pal [Lysobacter sp. N42]